ncbi:MAG: glycosyltransferase family 39 protein [Anaerolineaceae bacterium]|nr:glycosyltransferase family 39 protein [Anaerolineaceae bacterium]
MNPILVKLKENRFNWAVIGVVILALLVRVTYVLLAPRIDPIIQQQPLYGDASGYHLLAVNLLKGLGLTWDGQIPTSFRMPGYPAFLAFIYGLTRPDPEPVRLVQAVLGALTCIPTFALAERLGGRKTAVLAGLGVALHPIMIYMTAWLYSETLFFLLLWSGLWVLVRSFDNSSLLQAALAGLFVGAATLVRPEVMAFPALVLVAGWIFRWPRRLLGFALVAQVAVVIVLLPWIVRNVLVHDQVVVLTTNTGAVFYGGNNDDADGGYYLDVPFILPGFSELESDAEFKRMGVQWISNHPQEFIALLPWKLYKLFSPAEMVGAGRPLGSWTLVLNVIYGVFLMFVAGGIIVGWRLNKELITLLMTLIAWYILITLILYGGTRFALPLAPGFVTLAAVALVKLLPKREFSVYLQTEKV